MQVSGFIYATAWTAFLARGLVPLLREMADEGVSGLLCTAGLEYAAGTNMHR